MRLDFSAACAIAVTCVACVSLAAQVFASEKLLAVSHELLRDLGNLWDLYALK
jgi:hypothetical protein